MNAAGPAGGTLHAMIARHWWSCDTDDAGWAAGFDALLEDVGRLLAAAGPRGVGASGLSAATAPVVGPVLLALSDPAGGAPLLLHRADPAPWRPGQLEDADGMLPDAGPGMGDVEVRSPGFGMLAGAVLLRAVTRGGPAFRLASSTPWSAWSPARALIADVFGAEPASALDADLIAPC